MKFILKNNLTLMALLGACVLVYLAIFWRDMPPMQRTVGLFFVAIILHVWEESRFPGGFVEMISSRLDFVLKNPKMGELITSAYILYLAFVPLFFPHTTWLAMAAMILGVVEVIAHLAAIKMFRRKHFYTPGLVTAAFVLLPISIYGIACAIRNDLMRPWQWAYSLLYMVIGLAIAQGTVVRMTGMKYSEFLRKVRTSILSPQD